MPGEETALLADQVAALLGIASAHRMRGDTKEAIKALVDARKRQEEMVKAVRHDARDTVQREDGSRCDPGETGEICIKLEPNLHGILKEYYKNPEEQAKSRRGGWYHTGDTAWVDEDGYFFYVGRNDDVIKSSGYRIGPFEIESVLLQHQAVRECAVTGVPDELRGYAVKATVVLQGDFEQSDELTHELQTWVKHKTAPYKYPRIIDYVDELPKTTSGKIRRVAIRIADEERAHLPVESDKIDGLT